MLKIELKYGYWLELVPYAKPYSLEIIAHYKDRRSNISNLNWVLSELEVEEPNEDNELQYSELEDLLHDVLVIYSWKHSPTLIKALREDRKEGEWPSTT